MGLSGKRNSTLMRVKEQYRVPSCGCKVVGVNVVAKMCRRAVVTGYDPEVQR